MPKLKILCVVEGATISSLMQGDILTLANGAKFTVVNVGEADIFYHIPVTFEDGTEFWFFEDLRHYHIAQNNIVRIERWFTIPTNLFEECHAQPDTGVIIATIED